MPIRDRSIVSLALLLACFAACTSGTGDTDGGPGIDATLSSLRENIFTPNCSANACHGGDNPVHGLDLASDDPHGRLVDQDSTIAGLKLVVAGDPENSLLFLAVSEGYEAGSIRKMPPGVDLSEEKIDALRQWIEDGAADD